MLEKLRTLPVKEFETQPQFLQALAAAGLTPEELTAHQDSLLHHAAGRSYVAVVTVHGVGDQEPNETARAVANLLLSRNRQGGRSTPPSRKQMSASPPASSLLRRGTPKTPAGTSMWELLDGYEGNSPADTYDAIRLEGARLESQSPRIDTASTFTTCFGPT